MVEVTHFYGTVIMSQDIYTRQYLKISKCIVQRDGFVYMWCNSTDVAKALINFTKVTLYNCSQLGSQLPTEDKKKFIVHNRYIGITERVLGACFHPHWQLDGQYGTFLLTYV